MIKKITRIEDVKEELEKACNTHKALPSVLPMRSDISILGLLIPSTLWFSDELSSRPERAEITDMWYILEHWFVGLDRSERLIVLLRSGGVGFKTIGWLLSEKYKISSGTGRTTLWRTYERALLKIFANAKN